MFFWLFIFSGSVALKHVPLGSGYHDIVATDGEVIINALVSEVDGLVSCLLSEDKDKSMSLLRDLNYDILNVGM